MAADRVRRAAVAGLFYPSDPEELAATVDGLLDRAAPPGPKEPADPPEPPLPLGPSAPRARLEALIAPHAGFVYSGPVAATAYRHVAARAGARETVVLIGPAHRVPFRGLATSPAEGFETPLGTVAVDRDLVARIERMAGVESRPDAHRGEHALEVHLPFIQRVLDGARVVPILVGHAPSSLVAGVLETLWDGGKTVTIVSSDLSHYLEYALARRIDAVTASRIEAARFDEIGPSEACGWGAINGLLRVAASRGLTVRTADLRNSADTAGGRDRVVGYGAFLFESGDARASRPDGPGAR